MVGKKQRDYFKESYHRVASFFKVYVKWSILIEEHGSLTVDLPFTVKVRFATMAKNSQTEGEGGRYIPKRIMSSQDVHCSLRLSVLIYSNSLNWYLTSKHFLDNSLFLTGFVQVRLESH